MVPVRQEVSEQSEIFSAKQTGSKANEEQVDVGANPRIAG